jgi:pimeloyl-ACP methyl ester carboxylesterase
VHLVGHDWGAAVGWAVAAFRPDLVRSWTAFSVPHTAAYAKALLGPQLRRSWYMAWFNLPWLPERAARPGGALERMLGRSGMMPDDLARFRRDIVDDGALPGALGWYRALLLSMSSRIGEVAVPTTMVWSSRDGAIDERGVLDTERWCTGPYEYVRLGGVTHWIPTQAPEATAAAILARIRSVESPG